MKQILLLAITATTSIAVFAQSAPVDSGIPNELTLKQNRYVRMNAPTVLTPEEYARTTSDNYTLTLKLNLEQTQQVYTALLEYKIADSSRTPNGKPDYNDFYAIKDELESRLKLIFTPVQAIDYQILKEYGTYIY